MSATPDRCGYCGSPRDRLDVTAFGGTHTVTYGYCSARCVIPTCVTCDHHLDTERRCQSLDCPLYGHRQWEMTS